MSGLSPNAFLFRIGSAQTRLLQAERIGGAAATSHDVKCVTIHDVTGALVSRDAASDASINLQDITYTSSSVLVGGSPTFLRYSCSLHTSVLCSLVIVGLCSGVYAQLATQTQVHIKVSQCLNYKILPPIDAVAAS